VRPELLLPKKDERDSNSRGDRENLMDIMKWIVLSLEPSVTCSSHMMQKSLLIKACMSHGSHLVIRMLTCLSSKAKSKCCFFEDTVPWLMEACSLSSSLPSRVVRSLPVSLERSCWGQPLHLRLFTSSAQCSRVPCQ
jgi:hypothetical protein